jgi:hypothetical protein
MRGTRGVGSGEVQGRMMVVGSDRGEGEEDEKEGGEEEEEEELDEAA